MSRLLGMRPEDARPVWIAFATLLVIVAAHAVLETARDALFLRNLPAGRLPWAYLGIALLAFVVARASGPLAAVRSPGRMLALLLALGSAGTAAFWWMLATPTPSALMALYVWTGTLASVVVTQFWIQLGGQVDVGQARRAYAVVAAGGLLGATLGSLLAGAVLAVHHHPRALLPVAAAVFALAACLPAVTGGRRSNAERTPPEPAPSDDRPPTLRDIWNDAYLKRLVPLAALAPIIAMAVDFIFKSVVTHNLGRQQLGPFFARYGAIVNGLALVFQLLLAPRLLQRLGAVRSLCVLPGALGAGAVAIGVAGGAALPAALLLRGTDGVLRHSLHRAATEILFVPLAASTRAALRGLTEAVGQRGGQVVGSLLILGAVALGAGTQVLAIAVAMLCGLWLLGFVRLQRHYLDRFRIELRSLGSADAAAVPALDLQSLETLVATLSAPNDAEVLAAMDMLASFGRTRLIPPLILYHPSAAVVLRGLEVFDGIWREDVQGIRRRLLEHGEPAVRAAALRGLASGGAEPAVVRSVLRKDASPLVRATALTLWMGIETTRDADVDEAVADLVAAPDPEARLAVASTLGELPERLLVPVASALLRDATPAIRRRVAQTLAADPDASRLELLVELVAMPESRAAARAGLVAIGPAALEHVAHLLADPATPAMLRRHLPRTLSPFASERAAEVLLRQLDCEEDGRVVYKILRGLGRMRRNDPSLHVHRPVLVAYAERTLQRAITLLAYRVAWERLRDPATTDDLLATLLAEKEQRALERVFRVLQILEAEEDFATMYAALASDVPATRAGARELIDHVLDGRFRDALLALTDSLPPDRRLAAAAPVAPVAVVEAAVALAATSPGAPRSPAAADVVVDAMRTDLSVLLAALAHDALAARGREDHRVAS